MNVTQGAGRPSPSRNVRMRSPIVPKGSLKLRPVTFGSERERTNKWLMLSSHQPSFFDPVLSYPFKGTSPPGVEEPSGQDEDEQNTFQHHVQLKLLVGDSPWEEEDRFHIKNHKD